MKVSRLLFLLILILFLLPGCHNLNQGCGGDDNNDALLALAALLPRYHDNRVSPIGTNIQWFTYWNGSWPVIDAMKRSSHWLTSCDGCAPDTNEQASLDLDGDGWPRSLPAAADMSVQYRYVYTFMYLDARGNYPAGRYIVLYDGEGTMTYGADSVKNEALSTPGRDVVDVTPTNTGIQVIIRATDPNSTGNYLRNVRVIHPGGLCEGDAFTYHESAAGCFGRYRSFEELHQTTRFHPRYLTDLRLYKVLRFNPFLRSTYNTGVVTWANRPRVSHRNWTTDRGAPVEIALEMSNAVNTHAWLNIPVRADDDYIRQFARLALSTLNSNLKVYLEYHNEIWNTSAPFNTAGAWVEAQGVARWPGGVVSDYDKRLNWYALRVLQICDIWRNEWGAQANRIVCVMGGGADHSISERVLRCSLVAAETGVACGNRVDALAFAPYMAIYMALVEHTSRMETWLGDADGGLGRFFQEMGSGGLLFNPNDSEDFRAPAAGAIQETRAWIRANKSLADEFGIPVVAYEGGHHLANPYGIVLPDGVNDLYYRANRDGRMGAVYGEYLNVWREEGGTLFMHYVDVEHTTVFGAREYQTQSPAPRYDALMNFIRYNACWWPGCGD